MARKIRNLPRLILAVAAIAAASNLAYAQWDIEESHTKADLRGIDSVGKGIAWASGSNGTVLRTEDGGYLWQTCAIPPDAAALDFRGIQGFDANTAIVMSSGKGELSRLYETVDGCNSWKLLLTNPDPEGFWDSIRAADPSTIMILGDPVDGAFQLRATHDGGETWTVENTQPSWANEGVFAASNSSLSVNWVDGPAIFGTGSLGGARLFRDDCYPCKKNTERWAPALVPIFPRSLTGGIFSIHQSTWDHFVAVGGDYEKPDDADGSAAWSSDAGRRWHEARTSPHGYRSAVDYDAVNRAWVTVGPNGTDVSQNDGRDWQALKPGPNEPADADKNWNALSLPFAVGSGGRIGRVRPLPPPGPEPLSPERPQKKAWWPKRFP